ncbi:MAG: hypothetical protein JNJ71_20410 [Rubrivivax sp.]|nr:hypothetical protein [Rubrivivax sp.]
MDIHQIQLSYELRADRLLWQLRTREGAVVGVWLTRRMVERLWPHFQHWVLQAQLPPRPAGPAAAAAAAPTVMPQAREMLADVARQRPLPQADFEQPFDAQALTRPLGPEPLLPDAIDLAPVSGPGGRRLALRVRETGGRSLDLQLGDDLATALLRLMERAVAASEWFAAPAGSAGTEAAPGGPVAPPPTLN